VNLGEVLVGGNDRSKLTATTDLQAFALIVTAEPYFAVRSPAMWWCSRMWFARTPRGPAKLWMRSMS
jgi:hypothetical protein